MLIKRVLGLLVAMLGFVPVMHAQQEIPDSAKILGDWRIVKIEARLYAQKDNRLLEEKTLEIGNLVPQLRTGVPLSARFMTDSCILRIREEQSGTYTLSRGDHGNRLGFREKAKRPGPPLPIASYYYKFAEAAQLVLVVPPAYYSDQVRNEAVKMVYSCYYKRN